MIDQPQNLGSGSGSPTTQALIEQARQAVDRFRDFAREHGMHFRQRDPLVLDIHNVLDAFEEQSKTGRAAADALRSLEFERTRAAGLYADVERRNTQLSEQAVKIEQLEAEVARLTQARDTPPTRWMVVVKRETNAPDVTVFDRYADAALYWDLAQTQWSDVYFCRIAYGPEGNGMSGERPNVAADGALGPLPPAKEGQ